MTLAHALVQHEVLCSCSCPAELVTGETIYPQRPDLHDRYFWLCRRDGNYVGCHPGTKRALGTPADYATRLARSSAHYHFDLLWRSGVMKRAEAYAALAEHLGIPVGLCHVGSFDRERCWEVRRWAAARRKGAAA